MAVISCRQHELQLSILRAHLAQIESEMVEACEQAAARVSPGIERTDWDRATWTAYLAEGERQLDLTRLARMTAVQQIRNLNTRALPELAAA